MIRLIVDEYCQKCPEFEAEVNKDVISITDYNPLEAEPVLHVFADTNVYCAHRDRCKCMVETLRKDGI